MAEEHRCQSPPEGLRLCVNNCGFFGSSATNNLCSKCYRDFCLQEQQQSAIKSSFSATATSAASAVTASPSSPPPTVADGSRSLPPPAFNLPEAQNPAATALVVDQLPEQEQQPPQQPQPNRCFTCRKRVGLTGFKCRCGTTYCGVHRYPEKHACTFDFKKVGREEIARANPLVIAEKLEKI